MTFDIDANGILNVHAREQATGKEQKITITGSSSMDKNDIDRAVKEAEAHAADDAAKRESAETKNHLDSLVFQSQKFMTDNTDKIGSSEKGALEAAIAEAQEALKSDDLSRMKASFESLTAAYQAAGSSVYQQQAEAAAEQQQPSGSDFAGYDKPADGNGAAPNGTV